MSSLKEDVEISQSRGSSRPSSSLSPRPAPESDLRSRLVGSDEAAPGPAFGVKTRLIIRRNNAGTNKTRKTSPCESRLVKRRGRNYSPHFSEDDEENVNTNKNPIKIPDSILKKTKAESCVPGPSTSSFKHPPTSSSVASNRNSGSVMKFRARVTTLEEIVNAQSSSQLHEKPQLCSISQTSQSQLHCIPTKSKPQSKSALPPSIVISSPNSMSSNSEPAVLQMHSRRTNSAGSTRSSKKWGKAPSVAFTEPDDSELTLAVLGEADEGLDNSSDISGEGDASCVSCGSSCFQGCCGEASGRTSDSVVSAGRRLYWRDGWERLSLRLPLWLLNLLGFVAKIYWRLVDSVFGVNTPYRDQNGEGKNKFKCSFSVIIRLHQL